MATNKQMNLIGFEMQRKGIKNLTDWLDLWDMESDPEKMTNDDVNKILENIKEIRENHDKEAI